MSRNMAVNKGTEGVRYATAFYEVRKGYGREAELNVTTAVNTLVLSDAGRLGKGLLTTRGRAHAAMTRRPFRGEERRMNEGGDEE